MRELAAPPQPGGWGITRVMKWRFSGQAGEAAKDLGLALEAAAMLREGRSLVPACIPSWGQPLAWDIRNMNETWSPTPRPG